MTIGMEKPFGRTGETSPLALPCQCYETYYRLTQKGGRRHKMESAVASGDLSCHDCDFKSS